MFNDISTICNMQQDGDIIIDVTVMRNRDRVTHERVIPRT